MDIFTLVARLGLDKSEYERGLGEAQQDAQGMGSKIAGGLGAAAKLGAAAMAATTAATVAFGKSAIETGQQFDVSMSQIAATLGLTTSDIENNVNGAGDTFQALRDKAQEMGASTNFTAKEAAEGLNILAMSGYDAEQSMAMIEDVLHLAAAGSMDMASAAGYVSGAMKGFNDETKDSGYYADLMAKGATLANTSVQQLGEAMSSGAAGAAAYSQSADSMTVALLRLAEQGEVGSAAGTALSAAMKNLYTPTDQAKEALDELGIAAYENGQALDFNDIVNDLSDALSRYTPEQQAAYKQTIFGIQGLDAFNKMTVTSVERQNEWSEALATASDGAGEAAKQYGTMTDNLQGDLDILGSAMDGLKLVVSDQLTPTFREFVQMASNGLSAITEGFKEDGLKGAMTAIGEFLNSAIAKISEMIPDILLAGQNLLLTFTSGIIENLPSLLDAGVQAVITLANGIGQAYPELIPAAIDAVLTFADNLVDNLPELVDAALQLILGFAEGLIDAIPKIIERIPEIIKSIINALISSIPKIADAGIKLFSALIQNLPEIIVAIVKAIPEIIMALVNGFGEYISTMWKVGENLIGAIGDGLLSGLKWVGDKISGAGNWIIDRFKGLFGIASPSKVFMGLGDFLMQGLSEGIIDGLDTVRNAMSNVEDALTIDGDINGYTNKIATETVDTFNNDSSLPALLTPNSDTGKDITVVLELDGTQLARTIFRLNRQESQRVGLNLAGGFA